MSWSDDVRCLYCDGRLPLYRKITHGQFCSSAHRQQYWLEQERLAVERLHQTHDSLRAYVPPPDVRPPVEPAPAPLQPQSQLAVTTPEVAGHVPASLRVLPAVTPALVSTDPLEYEADLAPRHPASAPVHDLGARLHVAGPVPVEGMLAAAPLLAAGAQALTAFSTPYWNKVGHATLPTQPAALSDAAPAMTGLTPWDPWTARLIQPRTAPVNISSSAVEPGATCDPTRVCSPSLQLPPASELLDRLMEQLPHPSRLFPLGRLSAFGAGVAAPWAVTSEALPLAINRPPPVEHLFTRSVEGLSEVGRLPFALRSCRIEQGIPRVSLRPALFESKGSALPASLQTPPRLEVNPAPRLPISAAVLYSVTPRLARTTASKAAAPAPSQAARAAAIPALMLEVGDSSFGWSVPPAGKIPLTATVRGAKGSIRALQVLALSLPLRTKMAVPLSKLAPAAPKSAIEIVPPPMSIPAAGPANVEAPVMSNAISDAPRAESSATLAMSPWWMQATDFWKHGPRDLKLLLLAVPVMIAVALHPTLPKVHLSAGQPTQGISQAVETQLASFRQSLAGRAAVALDEDFRGGLDDWHARSGDTTDWSYDATGFVKPGPLALYSPSMALSDYQLQFLGLIGKKSLSWVVRASDFDNYYVVKLVERKGGPLPEIGVTRYEVIDGKAQNRVDTIAAIGARPEMMYLVKMDVKGNDFALWIQDQMVDNWSDTRLNRGGVGFFSAKGEEGRLRWVQITHQYDMLGRLCAYLAPGNISN